MYIQQHHRYARRRRQIGFPEAPASIFTTDRRRQASWQRLQIEPNHKQPQCSITILFRERSQSCHDAHDDNRSASQRCSLVLLPTRLRCTIQYSLYERAMYDSLLDRLPVPTCRVRACFGRPSRFTTGDGGGFHGSRPSTRWNLHARDEMDETARVQ